MLLKKWNYDELSTFIGWEGPTPLINGGGRDVHKRTNVVLRVILLVDTGSKTHHPLKNTTLKLLKSCASAGDLTILPYRK